jgi:hypothetical protein
MKLSGGILLQRSLRTPTAYAAIAISGFALVFAIVVFLRVTQLRSGQLHFPHTPVDPISAPYNHHLVVYKHYLEDVNHPSSFWWSGWVLPPGPVCYIELLQRCTYIYTIVLQWCQ